MADNCIVKFYLVPLIVYEISSIKKICLCPVPPQTIPKRTKKDIEGGKRKK